MIQLRLIDADALLETFEIAQRSYEKDGREFASSFLSSGGELSTEWWCVEDMVENAPTVSEWISVEERLPKTRPSILGQKSSKVIVAFQFDDGMQGTDIAHILNGDWVFEDRITVVNRAVTHWMPLPEPPKDKTRILWE